MRTDLIPPDELILANNIGVSRPTEIAKEFDAIGHGLIREIVRECGITATSRVLDVGCGLGRLARALTTILVNGSYEGLDVTQSSIDWCKDAYSDFPHFNFTHVDVFNTLYNRTATVRAAEYRFPFNDASFDVLYSTSLFTHLMLSDAEHYISEMARVLKPGGRAYNTFLLLDDVSEPLARTVDNLNLRMSHEVNGGLVVVPHTPEAVIGLRTHIIAELHQRSGLHIDEIRNGPWSGRTDNLKASYQDVILATRLAI